MNVSCVSASRAAREPVVNSDSQLQLPLQKIGLKLNPSSLLFTTSKYTAHNFVSDSFAMNL
jgi:hypothetical protein